MYKLKSIVRRGTMFGISGALLIATLVPALSYADALNPLTHRSLTLSSSAPGWDYTDGSGNPTYAQPNSGANGQKTGNTFQFDVSTDSSAAGTNAPLQAFGFQYCTTSAGNCLAPGNDAPVGTSGSYTSHGTDSVSAKQSDLNVVTSTPTEISSANYSSIMNSDGSVAAVPNRNDTQGNFAVLTSADHGTTWTQNSGWTMKAENLESGGTVAAGTATGKNNYVILYNSASTLQPVPGQPVKIVFFGTDGNYITNPGSGAFFVKINDYSALTGTGASTEADPTHLVDGGVTVANVMNQSIEIQTKVLETMDFSVGTVDPDTLTDAQLSTASAGAYTVHSPCNPILGAMSPTDPTNTLQMGNMAAENSLETTKTYSTHSYWRLSSNSSAGATVYYSGVTLSNTVGDQIKAIGVTAKAPTLGAEQFGLALANGTIGDNDVVGPVGGTYLNGGNGLYNVNYGTEYGGTTTGGGIGGNLENGADNGITGVDASTTSELSGNASYHAPQLYPLIPTTNYDSGAGTVNNNYATGSDPVNTKFAFDTNSNLIPTPIATESSQVVDCVTGKVRYIANIAATTPAGIYTTKVNYIAAPQY